MNKLYIRLLFLVWSQHFFKTDFFFKNRILRWIQKNIPLKLGKFCKKTWTISLFNTYFVLNSVYNTLCLFSILMLTLTEKNTQKNLFYTSVALKRYFHSSSATQTSICYSQERWWPLLLDCLLELFSTCQ